MPLYDNYYGGGGLNAQNYGGQNSFSAQPTYSGGLNAQSYGGNYSFGQGVQGVQRKLHGSYRWSAVDAIR